MAVISFFLRVAIFNLLMACSTSVHASPAIIVPWNITADQREDLTIKQRIDANSDLRKKFSFYRVYLALEPPGWGTGPVCWLAYKESLDTTQVNITIPADVAPDKSRIRISTSLFKNGASRGNGYSYSSRTTLLGANGTWSQRELDGWVISDENRVSCWALGCARRCHEYYYTGGKTQSSDGSSDGKADNCVNQCVKDLNPQGVGSSITMPMLGVLAASIVVGLSHVVL
ncbi:hypothetical protein B0T10DRAFT_314837 [Thelonectria olida]|uniref:Uncharacterized protein n=1 Tax=Thelonectria olida TaxID=1576542 RepID=A0A9P9AE20_9HYPO|nr:hypothetical protein B0T10DRAFT_314837 [Thelonectria olida]